MAERPGPLLRLLRVPPEPTPPAGSPESVLVFRAARSFWAYRVVRWLLAQVITITGIVFAAGGLWTVFRGAPGALTRAGLSIEAVFIGLALLQVPISLVLLRIDYRMRWYVVTDRSLRIREGAWTVREMTMTFANIQNIEVTQGPLQRLLGIADLRVQSAGGGGLPSGKGDDGGFGMHVGWFRGIDNAPYVRDLMRQRLRRYRGSGLGDIDDREAAHHGEGGDSRPVIAKSLREGLSGIRDAARELHATAARLGRERARGGAEPS